MKVLAVSPFLPFPLENGGAIRVYHLLRFLSRRHEVTLLCFGALTPQAREALRFCTSVHVVPPPRFPRPWWEHARGLAGALPASVCLPSEAMAARLRHLIASHPFDLVQVEFLGLSHLVQHLDGRRKVLVEHSITSELRARQLGLMPWGARRLYYGADLLKLRRYEPAAVRAFDACVTVSSRDAGLVRTWAPGLPVATIPNGVDTEYFSPLGGEEASSLLFLGSFHLDPANVDGVLHFARDILPIIRRRLPDVRLTVVGTDPPREVRELSDARSIEVTGRVEDVRPYLARAAAVILPLRAGAGPKLRIFTAMAMQKTVLATSVAAEGVDARPGEEIVIADGAERFAEETIALLRDAPRRARIGQAARARAVAQYDWRVIGGQLETFYTFLLGGGT